MDSQISNEGALRAYASYPFSSDQTYQQGLASLLAGGALNPNSPPDVQEDIKRQTRVFYFNKITGNSITAEEARVYELSLEQNATEHQASEEENRVLTFAELKEMIETGNVDKIPNNKVILEKLNDAPPSQSTATTRKKPWENASDL